MFTFRSKEALRKRDLPKMNYEDMNLEKGEREDIFRSMPPQIPSKVERKKRNSGKVVFVLFLMFIFGLLGYVIFLSGDDKINLSENIVIPSNITKQESIVLNDTGEVDSQRDVILRSGLENPRLSIRNGSGDEVIGLDHNGTIAAVDIYLDENVNITGNATGRYGFFSYIGSVLSTVTKGWFTDVVAGDVNATGNVTIERIKLEADASNHLIYDNASCVIILGDTSEFYVC